MCVNHFEILVFVLVGWVRQATAYCYQLILDDLHYLCKDPSLWKENKASSRAEDNTKSAEVGTYEVGHWSDLSGG